MVIQLKSRRTYTGKEVEEMKEKVAKPLDELFREKWILDSATGRDKSLAKELKEQGEDLRNNSQAILLLAHGSAGRALKAALYSALAFRRNEGPELILLPEGLYPGDYGEIIRKLEGKKASLIAVSLGEEGLAFNAAFNVFRKIAKNIVVICSESSSILEEAKESQYPIVLMEGTSNESFLGNREAVILPLIAAGVDAEKYLQGFAETVASPNWDETAALPAFMMAKVLEEGKEVGFKTEISEYEDMATWLREYFSVKETAPAGEEEPEPSAEILLSTLEAYEDIMLPSFEGCDEDGSLFNLMKREEQRDFFDESNEDPGFSLETEIMDEKNAGALMAFLQMTMALCGYINKGLH